MVMYNCGKVNVALWQHVTLSEVGVAPLALLALTTILISSIKLPLFYSLIELLSAVYYLLSSAQ